MSEFVAALSMYDWPETRAETDAEWLRLRTLFAQAGIDAPTKLARGNADLPPVPGGIRDLTGQVIAPDPATLSPEEFDFHALWLHPQLLLAQTCWGPMEQGLAEHVRVVGQPSYDGIEGGRGEFYSSPILMRTLPSPLRGGSSRNDGVGVVTNNALPSHPHPVSRTFASRGSLADLPGRATGLARPSGPHKGEGEAPRLISPLEREMAGRTEGGVQAPPNGQPLIPLDIIRDKRLAFNSLDSMSGIIALTRDLEAMGKNLDMFRDRVETGSHRASVVAVAEGKADVCAIDCRSWALAQRFEPAARLVEVVGWTARRKGLPMITSRHTPPDTVAALRQIVGRH